MPKEKTSYRILIVDDDAFLLDMYSLKFSQKGFQVTTSPGTLDALDKLRGGYVPDILLIDLVMPAMDGFAFLEQLQKDELARQAMVIVLSNLGQEEDILRAKKLGAADYIIKASATPSEVVDRVLKEVNKRKGS
ncbi:MAG TPA: response regulator [Candidatus Paceibacterota bacterium]